MTLPNSASPITLVMTDLARMLQGGHDKSDVLSHRDGLHAFTVSAVRDHMRRAGAEKCNRTIHFHRYSVPTRLIFTGTRQSLSGKILKTGRAICRSKQ